MHINLFLLATILYPLVLCYVHPSILKMDSGSIEDKNHLKEHLDPHVDVDSLSIEEIRFRYFKTHDTNGDNRLDGIEIIQAMLHFQAEDNAIGPLEYSFRDDELELFVDPIFQKSDANNDGFLDYTEFMSLHVGGSHL